MASETKVAKSATRKHAKTTPPSSKKKSEHDGSSQMKTPAKRSPKRRACSPAAGPSPSQSKNSVQNMKKNKMSASSAACKKKGSKAADSEKSGEVLTLKKPVSKRKSKPDLYKCKHNIGRRSAAGRVGSYKESEISVVFPDDYWSNMAKNKSANALKTILAQKRQSESSRSESETSFKKCKIEGDNAGQEGIDDDDSLLTNDGDDGNTKALSSLKDADAKKTRSVKGVKKNNEKSNSEKKTSADQISKAANLTTVKNKTIKSPKLKTKVQCLKKVKHSRFCDVRPRAPRIKRTACLNANAIVSLMYEKEEPQRILPKRQAPATSHKLSISDLDSEEEEATFQKCQQHKCDDVVKKKTGSGEDIREAGDKKDKKSKKVKKGKHKEKKPVVISPWSPPRRIASLNAQAILAACREERPKKPKLKLPESPTANPTNSDKAESESQTLPANSSSSSSSGSSSSDSVTSSDVPAAMKAHDTEKKTESKPKKADPSQDREEVREKSMKTSKSKDKTRKDTSSEEQKDYGKPDEQTNRAANSEKLHEAKVTSKTASGKPVVPVAGHAKESSRSVWPPGRDKRTVNLSPDVQILEVKPASVNAQHHSYYQYQDQLTGFGSANNQSSYPTHPKYNIRFPNSPNARTLGTQTNFQNAPSSRQRHLNPQPLPSGQNSFHQYGYPGQDNHFPSQPTPQTSNQYPNRDSWSSFPAFRQPDPYSYSQGMLYKDAAPRLGPAGLRYAVPTPPPSGVSPFDSRLPLPISPAPLPAPHPCSTPSMMPAAQNLYPQAPRVRYGTSHSMMPTQSQSPLPRALPPSSPPHHPPPHINTVPIDSSVAEMPNPMHPSSSQMTNPHHASDKQRLLQNPCDLQNPQNQEQFMPQSHAYNNPQNPRDVPLPPGGMKPSHLVNNSATSDNFSDLSSSSHQRPHFSTSQPVEPPVTASVKPSNKSKKKSETILYNSGGSKFHSTPDDKNLEGHIKVVCPRSSEQSSSNSTTPKSSSSFQSNSSGDSDKHLSSQQKGQSGPASASLNASAPSRSHSDLSNSLALDRPCECAPSPAPQLIPASACQPFVVSGPGIPVMPFRHYSGAFGVPTYEEQSVAAPPVAFGYYQPAGPLLQTVSAEPCFVSHSIGIPHPQVKVLVHNTNFVSSETCTVEKVSLKKETRSQPLLRPKPIAPVTQPQQQASVTSVASVKAESSTTVHPKINSQQMSHHSKESKKSTKEKPAKTEKRTVTTPVNKPVTSQLGSSSITKKPASQVGSSVEHGSMSGQQNSDANKQTSRKSKTSESPSSKTTISSKDSQKQSAAGLAKPVSPMSIIPSQEMPSSHQLPVTVNSDRKLSEPMKCDSQNNDSSCEVPEDIRDKSAGIVTPLTVVIENSAVSQPDPSLPPAKSHYVKTSLVKKKKKRKSTAPDDEVIKKKSKKVHSEDKALSSHGKRDLSQSGKLKKAPKAKLALFTNTSTQKHKSSSVKDNLKDKGSSKDKKMKTDSKTKGDVSPRRKLSSASPTPTTKPSSKSRASSKNKDSTSVKKSSPPTTSPKSSRTKELPSPKLSSKAKEVKGSPKKEFSPKCTPRNKESTSPKAVAKESQKQKLKESPLATVVLNRSDLMIRVGVGEPDESATKASLSPGKKKDVKKTVQTWQWEGEAEVKAVPSCLPDTPPEQKTCYRAIRHRTDGEIITERDCVLVKSGPRKRDIPFVAKISALWEREGEMMMTVLWFYRPEHTETERLPRHVPMEVFASKHRDVVPVACIEDKCYVLTYNEFCRHKAETTREQEGAPPRPPVVPPLEAGPFRLSRLPLPSTDPECVFLCRRVYDVKLKRVLKNPQIALSPSK